MKGSLRALTREYFVGNQTEQILGWHLGNFEKWAGFTLTALNNPYDPEERLITKKTYYFTVGGQFEVTYLPTLFHQSSYFFEYLRKKM